MRRIIMWQNVLTQGVERCVLAARDDGWELAGLALDVADGRSLEARYVVHVDARWHTREVEVRCELPDGALELRLTSDGAGSWWREGTPLPDLTGCLDVDLGITPATNTLPIRRLRLDVGASATLAAAWVRFSGLEVSRLEQRYDRLAPDRWRYRSASFEAELAVDGDGLVLDYTGVWRAIAQG